MASVNRRPITALAGGTMTATSYTKNIAARMGRWSASHRKIAIFGWLAFVISAVVIGTAMGQRSLEQNRNVGQAGRADQVLKKAGFAEAGALTEIVVVQDKHATISDPKFRSAVEAVVGAVAPYSASYHNLRSPLDAANRSQVSRDGHTALVEWDMNGKLKPAEKVIDPLTRATAAVARAHPGIYVGEAGQVSSSKAINKMWAEQLGKAGERSLPLTLLVLLVVFGSLVAALLPLTLALSSVIATIGLVSIVSHITPMDQSASTVVLLVGLAVGVDYSLFYLKREREERAAGRENGAALRAAAATSGRSVLISGATVTIAMAGMLFSGDKTFQSLSIATMIVVVVAMLGSLTVLPALLSKFGDGVEKGRIPFVSRLQRRQGGSRVWARIITPALRHPVVATLTAASVLLALAIPTLSLHTGQSGTRTLARNVPTVEALDRVEAAFPGQASPAIVAVSANTASPAFKAAVAQLKAATASAGHQYGAVEVEPSPARNVARISIPLAGSGTDATSTKALLTLRNRLLPETIGHVPGASYAVSGQTAGSYDWNQMMKRAVPIVFGFVLTFAFLLLLVSFRSIVIAAKAVVLNLLSVAAAYGVVVAVFQWGWGEHLLGFKSSGAITPWLPIFMFVLLFGLSMDYHVFILSRIRESFDRGMNTEDAIAHGIKTTAGTVTSAAIVMVGAFAIFATLPILDMKQMGIGLAAAVLLDATIVRGVLLPASMKLLGDWNWYLPRWLGWLPKFEPQIAPAREPVPAAA
jgi:RND superfamily putative drug exporter